MTYEDCFFGTKVYDGKVHETNVGVFFLVGIYVFVVPFLTSSCGVDFPSFKFKQRNFRILVGP